MYFELLLFVRRGLEKENELARIYVRRNTEYCQVQEVNIEAIQSALRDFAEQDQISIYVLFGIMLIEEAMQ